MHTLTFVAYANAGRSSQTLAQVGVWVSLSCVHAYAYLHIHVLKRACMHVHACMRRIRLAGVSTSASVSGASSQSTSTAGNSDESDMEDGAEEDRAPCAGHGSPDVSRAQLIASARACLGSLKAGQLRRWGAPEVDLGVAS